MNEIDFDALRPGREMDALVAERVMGWMVSPLGKWAWEMIPPDSKWLHSAPNFSTDLAAAWTVDRPEWRWVFREADENGLNIHLHFAAESSLLENDFVRVRLEWRDFSDKAAAYAFGRCKAALMAVTALREMWQWPKTGGTKMRAVSLRRRGGR